MIKQTAFETDQHEVVSNIKTAQPLPEDYRITPARGYFYPQKHIGDVWHYFPANGPLFLEEIRGAKRCRTYENAAKHLNHYAASEQKAWESGLFDGIPTLKAYNYSGLEASR